MAFSVQMPALGESVTEGTVTRWLKQEGDQVAVDEPLLEVSTDKVDTEIPSPAAGVLSRIVVGEDETVDVGAELAVIDSGGGGGAADSGSDSGGSDSGAGSGSDSGSGGSDAAGDRSSEAVAETRDEHPEPAAESDDQAEAPSIEQDQPTAKPVAEAQAPRETSGGGSGTPVTMPALGESVTEGTVTRWLKQVGEQVAVDEPLLEVSTDKVDTEIPSPVAGTVLQIDVGEDETVEVGAQLAMIGSGDAGGSGGSAPSDDSGQDAGQDAGQDGSSSGEAQQQRQEDAGDEPAAKPEQREQEPAPASQSSPQQQAAAAHAEPSSSNGAQPATPSTPSTPASSQSTPPPSAGGAPYVTPLVRKLAAEHDVDLAGLQGTGVGGRIRKQDVLEAAEAAKAAAAKAAEEERQRSQPAPQQQPAAAAPAGGAPTPTSRTQSSAPVGSAATLRGTTVKMTRLRQTIARRMVESLQVSAQLTTVLEVDVTRIARLRDRAKRDFEAREGVKLSYLPFLAKAAVEALKSHPMVNASINSETNEVTYHGAEHLGVAVDTERGLLVPVIHDAGDLNIAGIARRIADLAERTRANKVSPDELGGGTFTLTNTGSRGALFDTPIINQPQVAILGTGAVVKRPIVVSDDTGDTIAIRSMMYLALSYDHRIVDGADAARFLSTMKTRLEDGNFEADL